MPNPNKAILTWVDEPPAAQLPAWRRALVRSPGSWAVLPLSVKSAGTYRKRGREKYGLEVVVRQGRVYGRYIGLSDPT